MSDWTTTGALVLGGIVILYLGQQALRCRTPYPLPPGPPGIPWIGNVIGVDTSAVWKTYTAWSKMYGDIVHSKLLGNDIIIINSEKIAKDLLENRSENYSDRPYSITSEKCGLGFNSIFLRFGDRWRLHRRLFHQTFRPDAVHRFFPVHQRKACHFLHQLLKSPKELDNHVFEYTAAIIMNSTYDYDPTSRKDELVNIVADVVNIALPIIRPEVAVAVGAFPWLLYLPSWFPGMSFKGKMAIARELSKRCLDRPFEHALQRVRGGSVAPSMVHDGLQEMADKENPHKATWMDALKEASATAFIATSQTSNSVLMTFFLMMVVNQGAQQRAQAEIDAVVGKDRLPRIGDRPSLPFTDAIFRETFRYNPVAPLSVPHAATGDGVYKGFHIPKDSILLANVWAMSRDESRFPNPNAFMPERFVNADGSLKPNEVEHIAFGFGPRMCAGQPFADASVWLVMVSVLAAFKVLRPVDENGVEMEVEPKFSGGNLLHPLPFGFRIEPRLPAEKLEQLIGSA